MYIDYSKITTEVLEQIYIENKDDIEVYFKLLIVILMNELRKK